MNQQGMIVGDTYDSQGHYHAFLWNAAHGPQILKVPGAEYSSALALNDRAEILLKATPGGVFLYSGGDLHAIDIPKGTPRAMNNDGIVVGSFGPNPDAQRAFVWDKTHGMQDLNTLIPAASGWTLEVASSINDRGEIVGWGDHDGVENVGYLLRPSKGNKSHPHAVGPAQGGHSAPN
jgi:probable HAF family extracellular repeat protein